MPTITINLTDKVVPKKNSKTARIGRRSGRAYLHRAQAAISSEEALHWSAVEIFGKTSWKTPTAKPVSVTMVFPYHPQADGVGLAETVLDALQGVAYLNDKQAKETHITMLPKVPKHMADPFEGISCRVTISEIEW